MVGGAGLRQSHGGGSFNLLGKQYKGSRPPLNVTVMNHASPRYKDLSHTEVHESVPCLVIDI